ncbi:MAG: SufD family Fe-S cluster assembly protein [Ignavibacteriaceae bacterium]
MENKLDLKELFVSQFAEFEKSLNGDKLSQFHKLRKSAIDEFNRLPVPTQKDEEWKYTNISPLLKHNFTAGEKNAVNGNRINKFLFDELEHSLMVFVNGLYAPELSRLEDIPNKVQVSSLADEIKNSNPVIAKHFGKYAAQENQLFTALSTAFTKDGAFVYVPDGTVVENAIHIIFLSTSDQKIFTQPRNLFVAGKNSQVTIIEHYISDSDNIYFTNTVTEIVADENAIVDHIKLQEESKNAFHIARMEVDPQLQRNCRHSEHPAIQRVYQPVAA